ncbi:DUF3040 domain-containing protein [Thermomonospora umbrina]|uniref:DUF3040 family protein n=1 Tax=Thermomonospora umbrina TaxID=111806 RepID=A0A3D9SXV8_9ACTN|nr:DUF3040 domain-containing protein [Thermomonospora umbrina]REF00398.1 DUF3040 family protein [Thermomonospora umbrina]
MALSMEEQRILAEIETRLAQDDPGLAGRLSGMTRARRRRRVRRGATAVAAVVLLVLVVMAVT